MYKSQEGFYNENLRQQAKLAKSLTLDQLQKLSQQQRELGKNPKYVIVKRKKSDQPLSIFNQSRTQNLYTAGTASSQNKYRSPYTKSLKSSQILHTQQSPQMSKQALEALIGIQSPTKFYKKDSQSNIQSMQDITQNNQIKQQNNNNNHQRMKTETSELHNSKQLQQSSSSVLNKHRKIIAARPESKQQQIQQQQDNQSNESLQKQNNENQQQQEQQQQEQNVEQKNTQQDDKISQKSTVMGKSQTSNMFKSYSNMSMKQTQKFETLLSKNQQYLDHLRGDCLCGRCLCGKCRCPRMMFMYDQDKAQKTNYQASFKDVKGPDQDLPQITMALYDQVKPEGGMEYNTTQRRDFQKHSAFRTPSFKKKQEFEEKPLLGGSSYRQNFINWGMYQSIAVPQKNNPTIVPDLHFTANTIYKNDFNKGNNLNKDNDLEFIKNWGKRPNFKNPDFPFQKDTTNRVTYKEIKEKPLRYNAKPQMFNPQPAYDGQFKSTSQKQQDIPTKIECPSRKELNQMYRQEVNENHEEALKYQAELRRGAKK